MYTIRRAAQLVGVPESTLRAWERRYGVAAPGRTAAGYRLYDDAAVRRLTSIKALVDQGWSARQAAEEVQARAEPTSTPMAAADPAPDAASDLAGSDDAASDIEALLHAAAELDAAAVGAVVDRRFAATAFEAAVDDWLLPALRALGEAWSEGRVTVAGEHLVAAVVQRRLSACYDAAATAGRGPRVIIALPPGSRHELGLLAFAVAARRSGLASTYLGADLPVDDWVAACGARDARAAVLSLSDPDRAPEGSAVVAALRTTYPDLLVAVGGAAQDAAPEECLRLGHAVGPAAALLADRLIGAR